MNYTSSNYIALNPSFIIVIVNLPAGNFAICHCIALPAIIRRLALCIEL
jgi:hypothetical protein